jgi:hypothetical protein
MYRRAPDLGRSRPATSQPYGLKQSLLLVLTVGFLAWFDHRSVFIDQPPADVPEPPKTFGV